MAEVKAFFGLLYLWASLKSNLSLADVIWHHKSSNDLFVATMSMKRFQFIGRFIEFDVIKTREERWKHNKFASMRYIWWCELQICQRSKPKAVSSDWWNKSFKQYNRSKPGKYGLLHRSLCDASVPYTYCSLPYAGKPDVTDDEANKYYVMGADNYTKYLVNGFCKFNKIKGCNISMDRYFTSVPLAK